MANVVRPFNEVNLTNKISIFLSGSMTDWRRQIIKELNYYDNLVIFDPTQPMYSSLSDDEMNRQVKWELKHLLNSTIVAIYFAPNNDSNVTFFEFGLRMGTKPNNTIIYCESEYKRFKYVYTTCALNYVPLYSNWHKFENAVKCAIERNLSSIVSAGY